MNNSYYYKYLKYKTKYINLLQNGKGKCRENVFTDCLEIGGYIYLITEKMLGSGVDGCVYEAFKDKEKIVAKVMDKKIFDDDESIKEFITINKLADEKGIGPKIHEIYLDNENIYTFMDDMDQNLTQFIRKKIEENLSKDQIENEIKNIVFPIHKKMYQNNINLGDDNMDNYMSKNGKWYRIDFTQNKLKRNKKNDYLNFSYFNPSTKSMEKIYYKDFEL